MTTASAIPGPTVFPHVLVVQASAGAGKTYCLSLRFLQLLALRKPSPEALRRVMALTFTVAAAQEMKSRIVSFLKDIALQTPQGELLHDQSGLGPAAASDWLDCILAHFQGFQVKTIDSLHFQMVQALGRRMSLWPELETSFDQAKWARLMLDSLLARTDWDEAPADQASADRNSLRSLWEGIFSVYLHLEERSGIRFLKWLEGQAVHVFSGLDQVLGPLQTTSINNLKDRRKAFEQGCQTFWHALEDLGLEGHLSRFKPEALFADPLRTLDSAFYAKCDARELFKKSAHARPGLDLAWAGYLTLCGLRDTFLLEKARLRVDPLARLQRLLIREADRLGRSQGLLLGGWWTRLIRQHLAGSDLLLEAEMILNARWRHILIDEFQDTSREQWEVLRELALESLAQGGSLFCVGDVKQAIYAWRGGDWQLFFEPLSPQTFPNVEDHARTQAVLPYNRRSCPEIVTFNTTCFASLEDPRRCSLLAETMISGKDRTQARAFLSSSIAMLYASARQKPWEQCAGSVHVRTLQAETIEEYRKAAMDALLREIAARREAGIPLDDTAILVRTNAEAGECARKLLGQGVPTITEQSLLISGHPHVRGLLSLLAFLDNPEDDAALFALCHSPLLSAEKIDMPGLVRARRTQEGNAKTGGPLYRVLERENDSVWTRHLEPFLEQIGFSSAYEALLAAVGHFALRTLPLGEWAWVEKLLEAAWSAEMEGAFTIASFLEYWREKGSSCVVGLPEGLDAVRVMTMHKAKGLEFPRVILPFLDYGPKNRNAFHVLRTETGDAFLASTGRPRSRMVAEATDRELAKNMAEELNLLYVALTRARQELHLFLADIAGIRGARASDWLRVLLAVEELKG